LEHDKNAVRNLGVSYKNEFVIPLLFPNPFVDWEKPVRAKPSRASLFNSFFKNRTGKSAFQVIITVSH